MFGSINHPVKCRSCQGPTPIAADFVLQNENYRGRLQIVGEPFTDEYYGIAVQKGNSAVLDRISAGLQAVLNSGRNVELEEKWLR